MERFVPENNYELIIREFMKSKIWKVVYIEDNTLIDVQLARKTKILGNEYTQ